MPEASRREVAAARVVLYLSVQVWFLWAGIRRVRRLGLVAADRRARGRARDVLHPHADGDPNLQALVESCYDIHRGLLYEVLRWPRPATPREEHSLA
jgi:hypothetical protein